MRCADSEDVDAALPVVRIGNELPGRTSRASPREPGASVEQERLDTVHESSEQET
jgi:hypothetical protein